MALRFEIDSWRWAGVPWLIRTGKRWRPPPPRRSSRFNDPPRLLFADAAGPPRRPNHLRFRLGSNDGVTLHLQAKTPGDELVTQPIDLDVSYDRALGTGQEAYQRLLDDAIEGDRRRFGRADASTSSGASSRRC